jgi:hypothetical protein
MMSRSEQPSGSRSVDRRVLLVLRKKSAQTMEDFTTLTGMGWKQVFFSVDRLSRS